MFKLDSTGHETVLYSFCSGTNCTDGATPHAEVIQDAAGNLYGTTSIGGANGGGGTVFKVAPPTLVITGTPVNVSAGTTAASTITVTPGATFTGNVVLTAAVTSSPAGAQDLPMLSFGSTSPVSITGGAPGTANLTITTTAATSRALAYPERPGARWYAIGGANLALALAFGMGIPARRRSRRTRLSLLFFLLALTGGLLACGGGGSGGGGGGNPGTTAGTYVITVTGTSGSTTAAGTVTLTVQ